MVYSRTGVLSMIDRDLFGTASAMVAPGKGILAIDESSGTCNKRFEKLGIEPSLEQRRAYRELLLTTPGLGQWVSGVILYDETLRQATAAEVPFVDVLLANEMLAGIKVDTGTVPLAGSEAELITEGLDGLAERVAQYRAMGARFAKWRAVYAITPSTPTRQALSANSEALARYARICQDGGLVPIVEPEILAEGTHHLERCYEVTRQALLHLFTALAAHGVDLAAMILKPNMVTAGTACANPSSVEDVANATVDLLSRLVPPRLAGIAFLSGGQSDLAATAHLNAMNALPRRLHPWPLTFSFGRAIQQGALAAWRGAAANRREAQQIIAHRSACNAAASMASYSQEMESQTRHSRITAV